MERHAWAKSHSKRISIPYAYVYLTYREIKLSLVTESKVYVPQQLPEFNNSKPKLDGSVEQRYVQPLVPKPRMMAEEAKVKNTFREQAVLHRFDTNGSGLNRAKRDASVYHQKTPTGQVLEKEATATKSALDEWAKKNAISPDGPPVDTAQHVDDFEAVADRSEGDALLATATSQKMQALTEADLSNPSPQVVVPKKSTLYPWMLQVSAAFTNRILRDWTVDNKVDPASLRYDTLTNTFHAKTLDGKELSFTKSEFSSEFPEYKEALDPIIDVAKVVAPKGRVQLQKYPEGSAGLDLIQSFYGLDPNEKSLEKIHEIAKELHHGEFPNATQNTLPGVTEVVKHRVAMEQKEKSYVNKLAPEVEHRPDELDFETSDANDTIAASTGEIMANLDQVSLNGPTPLIDIPPKSSLTPWLQQVNAAFGNKILMDWADNYDVKLDTLKYDPSLMLFGVQTLEGKTLNFTAEEFAQQYPKYRDGLTPIIDVAKVVSPAGGVILQRYPDNKAGLDLVLSFYGLDPTEKNIEKVNQTGNELLSRHAFAPNVEVKERNQQTLSEQQQALQARETEFTDRLNSPTEIYPLSPKEQRQFPEAKIVESTADAMLKLDESNKDGSSAYINISEDSKLYPWYEQVAGAFNNDVINEWASKFNIDRNSFTYDAAAGVFHAKKYEGKELSYTPEQFSKKFPKFSNALEPIVDVAKVVAPNGGVVSGYFSEDTAPLSLVLNFFGVDIKGKSVEEIHEMARTLNKERKFPDQPALPDRSEQALESQQKKLEALNNEYYEKTYGGQTEFQGIELSEHGGVLVPNNSR